MRECLLIIPTTKPQYEWGFSAPMAWMFSGLEDYLTTKYSCELTILDVIENENFIIEVNWVTEIYEALLISDYIKCNNKNSKILIGGYYAQIHYSKFIKDFGIDYFIKGNNEKSIKLFLEGSEIKSIPNFVTSRFENKIEYVFSQKDYNTMSYSLKWNPQYYKAKEVFNTSTMEKFQLPMIITSRLGCSCVHDGCDYCIGSKRNFYKENYNSNGPIKMTNTQLINHLYDVEKKFKKASIQILSPGDDYDFTNHSFDLDVGIEIEGGVSFLGLMKIISAFKKEDVHITLPLNLRGVMNDDILYQDRFKIIDLIEEGYDIQFLAYSKNDSTKLFEPFVNYDIGSTWANEKFVYKNYINFDKAYSWSKEVYDIYGHWAFKKTLRIF